MCDTIMYKSLCLKKDDAKRWLPDTLNNSTTQSWKGSKSSSKSFDLANPDEHGRISKVTVYTSNVIDQVKIVYDNGSCCCYGSRTKHSRSETALFTPGEYLVRITHRPCIHGIGIGCAMELETNKGLKFSYQPSHLAMQQPRNQSTFKAQPGYEITFFEFSDGVMTDYNEKYAFAEFRVRKETVKMPSKHQQHPATQNHQMSCQTCHKCEVIVKSLTDEKEEIKKQYLNLKTEYDKMMAAQTAIAKQDEDPG